MIYICIPALNEARTVGVLLWKIRQVMEEFPRDYHVLVLDDGSTDDTAEVLEPYARVLPVTVLRNERTGGYAAAVEKLIREAVRLSTHPKRDVLVVMQADFTESPDDIPNLLKRVEGGADVVGSSVAGVEGELPRSLRWGRKGLPWLLPRGSLPKEIKDPLSGFRAYRVSVLKRALQDGKPLLTKQHGWAANAELLLSVAPHVRRAENAEVQLRYTRRERETRFRPWSTALELWNLARSAPRRLAQARAAAAAAPPEPAAPHPAPEPAPATTEPARSPRPPKHAEPGEPSRRQRQRERQADRGAQSERTPRPDGPQERGPKGERGPRGDRPPRPERQPDAGRADARPPRGSADAFREGGLPDVPAADSNPPSGERPAVGERAPKPERQPKQRRERQPAPAAEAAAGTQVSEDAIAAAMAEEAPQVATGDQAAQPARKRRRPPRRRGRKNAGGPETGDAQTAAPDASAGEFDAGAEAAAESSVGTPMEPAGAESVEGGEGEAPARSRRRSRPRRSRRSRAGQPGAEGG
ncbi:MAG TPA: glycosyltransferase, partial [Longimicrobium sp.]|nr:glycosyltransferase [Longimicrobium sp.]